MLNRQIEYEKMAKAERELWWYRALHRQVLHALQAHPGGPRTRIIDAGCGTGGLLQYLRERGFENLTGFDVSSHALQLCHERGLPAQPGDLRHLLQLAGKQAAEIIISNDTLYFFSDKERMEILRGFWEVLAAGGLLLLNVPALPAFRGIHDVSVGIEHRFSKAEMAALLNATGFEVVQARYWPFVLSPAVYATRLWQRLRMKMALQFAIESDVGIPSLGLNTLLEGVTCLENALLPWKPFGSSLFVVARKLPEERVQARVAVDQPERIYYVDGMSAAEIIAQVQKLSPAEVFELSQWLREYEAELWDKQIEADIRSGKLDKLGEEALAELRAGKTRPFPE